MNIDKFKHQHLDILRSIDLLRQLTYAGIDRKAARQLVQVARVAVQLAGSARPVAAVAGEGGLDALALQAHGLRLLGHQVGENGLDSKGIYHHKQVF